MLVDVFDFLDEIENKQYKGIIKDCPRCGCSLNDDNRYMIYRGVWVCEDCFLDTLPISTEDFDNWDVSCKIRCLVPDLNIVKL